MDIAELDTNPCSGNLSVKWGSYLDCKSSVVLQRVRTLEHSKTGKKIRPILRPEIDSEDELSRQAYTQMEPG